MASSRIAEGRRNVLPLLSCPGECLFCGRLFPQVHAHEEAGSRREKGEITMLFPVWVAWCPPRAGDRLQEV